MDLIPTVGVDQTARRLSLVQSDVSYSCYLATAFGSYRTRVKVVRKYRSLKIRNVS